MGKPQTQKEAVEKHLTKFGHITSFDAFKEYGITRLSHIIYKLRKKFNWDIETVDTETTNRFGNPVVYATYKLIGQPQ